MAKKMVVRLKDLSVQAMSACVKLSKGITPPAWEVKALKTECKRLMREGRAMVIVDD